MIDTVRLNTPIDPDVRVKDHWENLTKSYRDVFERRDRYTHMGVRFSLSRRSGRSAWLSAEASYPTLVFGHNIGTIDADEVGIAHDLVGRAIASLPLDTELPAVGDWQVSRIDMSHAWRVGDPSQLIKDIHPFVRRRRSSDLIMFRDDHTNGVSLVVDQPTKSRILYDKQEQTRAENMRRRPAPDIRQAMSDFSQGVLKFESTAERRRIRETIFDGNMRARDLEHFARTRAPNLLQQDLHELIRNWRPSSTMAVARRLADTYSRRRSKSLFGLFSAIQDMGLESYSKFMDVNPEVLRRDLADLENAGIGFGHEEDRVRLDIPSPQTVWCRDLDLRFAFKQAA